MGCKEQHDGECPALFCLIYVRLEAGEAGNPDMPMGTKKGGLDLEESLLSVGKGPGRGSLAKQKIFRQ